MNSLTNLKLISLIKTARHVQFAIRDFYNAAAQELYTARTFISSILVGREEREREKQREEHK